MAHAVKPLELEPPPSLHIKGSLHIGRAPRSGGCQTAKSAPPAPPVIQGTHPKKPPPPLPSSLQSQTFQRSRENIDAKLAEDANKDTPNLTRQGRTN